ncbi:MAG TPA: Ig-like domain-containing protein, partial [Gemmatimonadales bacterium]
MPTIVRPLALALALAGAACTSKSDTTQPNSSQARILLSPRTMSLTVGDSIQLFVIVLSADSQVLDTAQITYGSSDSTVASVDAGGMIHARAGGQATITVHSNNASGTLAVSVSGPVPQDARTLISGRVFGAAVSSTGVAYVTQPDLGLVLRVNMSTHQVTDTIALNTNLPTSVTFDNAGNRAYVGNQDGGSVSVIDVPTNTVTATISLPAYTITSVLVLPADTMLLVGTSGALYYVRIPSNTVVDSVMLNGVANAMVVRDGQAYLNSVFTGAIHVVNLATRQVVD